jgi:SRSO17 transposase
MATETPGRHSEQSLQQFVNQSTWDHEAIRERLMRRMVGALRPTAWVIEEVAFPKHGRLSAAVERQYVRSLQKLCNCQLSVTVTLTTDRFSVPVNWRLIVPDAWGRDQERRARARMPQGELPRPYWQYQIELLDDMALDWGMPPAPVVADTRQLGTVEGLLSALEDRVLPYLVQVSDSQRVRYHNPTPPRVASPSGGRTSSWLGGAGDLVHRAAALTRTTVGWQGVGDDLVRRSQFLQMPVHSPDADGPGGRAVGRAQRRLLVEWPLSKPHPRGYWITNIQDGPLDDLVALAKLRQRVGPRIEEIAGRFGLRDYEGRTFVGWHRHVTLATAAHIFDLLSVLRGEEDEPEPMERIGVH